MSVKTNLLKSIGNYFHVYNRGVNRNAIFIEERNYDYFLQRVLKYKNDNEVQIIAYCLMPNHFHFILYQVAENGISHFIKSVCDGYAKAINKMYEKSGHLFEGKYKLKHIDDEQYLLHLSRYIHLNPVEANLATKPEDWKFSSYGEYIGRTHSNIVTPSIVLNHFKNVNDYENFVQEYKSNNSETIDKYLFDE